jgi:hypothetical protein
MGTSGWTWPVPEVDTRSTFSDMIECVASKVLPQWGRLLP